MTKLILIRHGKTTWNLSGRYQGQTNTELSLEGIEQAKKIATRLRMEKIDQIYSSDLSRAYQTAKHIAHYHSLTVQKEYSLREIDFGQWEGLTYDQIEQTWPQELHLLFTNASQANIPGGETIQALTNRLSSKIDQLVSQNEHKTIVVVSHGMAIRSIIAHYLHIPIDFVWSIRQDNTAINILSFYDHKAVLELLNDTCHIKNC